ncbi:MAG: hypothetical protein COA47_14780 [Robiginitomaculum sp.]|nr:MAG: hypothetical protein COA47_14780 [Robiginitomaculum sp.]
MVTNSEFIDRQFLTLKKDLLDNYEFVGASEIRAPITLNSTSVLSVILQEKSRYPLFQFTSNGIVFPALQKILPKLLQSRSSWDVCFWLTTERAVMMSKAVPNDEQTKSLNSLDKIIELGEKAHKQSTYVTSTPLKLLQDGENSIFQVFCEDLLNPDDRMIPEKKVII